MNSAKDTAVTGTTLRMALLALMTSYYAKQGYTAETRAIMRQALAHTASFDLSLIHDTDDRREAIVSHAEAVAHATEERRLERRKEAQK